MGSRLDTYALANKIMDAFTVSDTRRIFWCNAHNAPAPTPINRLSRLPDECWIGGHYSPCSFVIATVTLPEPA